MFRKPVLLKPQEHMSLKLAQMFDYGFAREQMSVPVVFSEMADVAREYPLLFMKGRDLPIALLGAEAGVNAYVNAEGRWQATYVPAFIKVYPFALMQVPDKPAEVAILIDAGSEHVGTQVGLPLFEADGTPAQALQTRIDILRKMRQQEAVTNRMVRQLRESGLLVERAIRARTGDAEERQLTGIEFVNEKALNELPHEDFAKLRDQGLLPLIYAHLLSMSNLRHGAIAGRYAETGQVAVASSQIDVDAFLRDADKTAKPEDQPTPQQHSEFTVMTDDDLDLTHLTHDVGNKLKN